MGIKRNILYSTFLTGANLIFPFITYPYISRVLGVEKIGICNFALGFINYFMLFAMMGITTIGIREIAQCRSDKDRMSKVFSSIFFLNLISSLIVSLVYLIVILLLPSLQQYRTLLLIGALQLLFASFMIEWLYRGVEDFLYITKRSILIRIFYVIALFLVVRTDNDYELYFILTVISMIANTFFNWKHKRKHIKLDFRHLDIKRFLRTFLLFGFYGLLTSMYISFNVVYLGFSSTTIEVGYYVTATKLLGIILAFFTAFSSVMMPRVSSLLANKELSEVKRITYKSFELVIPLSLNLIIFCFAFAPQIILFISGNGYEGAIIPMRIMLPLVGIIGIEQILVVQLLTPMKQDRAVFINSFVGAIVGLVLNFLLVPYLGSIGSACVWLCSELCVTISAIIFIQKKIGWIIPNSLLLKNLLMIIPNGMLYYFIINMSMNYVATLFIAAIVSVLYFVFCQWLILRNSIFQSLKIMLKLR